MKKLNLGCGPNIMSGWDNLDLEPGEGGVACDLTNGLPYADNSVDYIYSEHFIEHLSRDAALSLLVDCNRVLRPGGMIRFATPDLSTAIQDYKFARLDRWSSVGFTEFTPCQLLNGGMRYWGHKFLYDWNELELLFKMAGFFSLQRMPWRVSNENMLCELETRPFLNDLILEGQKFAGASLPTVTVIMASYNHERYVGQAIESVLNQTFQDFEFCITDDGSTDGTIGVIKSYNDPRIKFVALEENKGACYAMNHAIRRGCGKYVAVINSDDCFLPEKLEKQVRFLEQNEAIAAVFSTVNFVQSDGQPLLDVTKRLGNFDQPNRTRQEWLTHLYFNGNCLAHPSAMVRMGSYLFVGHYDERFRQLPDYLMWLRILRCWNIHVLDEPLIKFRVHDDYRNESAPTTEGIRRVHWESIQIFKEIMALHANDFRFLAKMALPNIPDNEVDARTRETVFAEIAMIRQDPPMIEAAIQLLYETTPANGSGGSFHNLKLPSALATLIQKAGLQVSGH